MSNTLFYSQKILELRKRLKYSQATLAEKLGVTPAAIGQLERGESKSPSADLLAAMSSILSVNLDWLLLGRGPMLKAVPPEELTVTEEPGVPYTLNPNEYLEPDGHPFGVRLLAMCQDASGRVVSMMVRPEELLQEVLHELTGRVTRLEEHRVEQLTA